MSIHGQNLIRANWSRGNMFCGKHEVTPVSEQNDDAFSWLCLRDKGNIYLFISYFLFFHGVAFFLTTEWDTGFFPSTCPSLHLPVQIQAIIKRHSCHLMSPEKQRLGETTEHATVGSIPLMASMSQHFQRWITPTNWEGDGVNPAPQQLCCKPLHMADPWWRGLGTANWEMSWPRGSTFFPPLEWPGLASMQKLLLVTILHEFFSSSYHQLRTQ